MRSVYIYRMKEEKTILSPWRESNPTSSVTSPTTTLQGLAGCANAHRSWPNIEVEYGWFVLSTVLHF